MEKSRKNSIQNNNGIITGRPLIFPYTKGIGQTFFEKLKEAKSKVAQIDGLTGEKDTYEAFTKRCIRTAIAMRAKGIIADDIVTVCSNNHLNTCVPLIASFFLGAVVANTDPNLSIFETSHLLNQVRPKIIFVSTNAVSLIEDVLKEIGLRTEIVVFGQTIKHTPFSEFLVETKDESNFEPVNIADLNKTCAIFFSSGSSGMPKGICLNHKTLLIQPIVLEKFDIKGETIILSTSPPYWISHILFLRNSIINGSCRVLISHFDFDTLWELVEDYKISLLMLAPSRMAMMCGTQPPTHKNISSLQFIVFGGTTFSKEMVQKSRELFPNSFVLTGYGLTEFGGVIIIFPLKDEHDINLMLQKPLSSGQPAPGVTVKIVDVETEQILGPNQKGELRIKTEYKMNGYYNLDSSDQCMDEDGFLKTGDLGYYDDDYYFYITDRIKEMLKYQSWHISPIIIENILMKHPAVEIALVIGIPHPIDNEHAMGLVVLKDIYKGKAAAEEIAKYVNDQVDNTYKLRAGVKIIEKLYKTPSEKFKRKYMKDLVLAGKL